jgi:hypothetical protein
MGSLLCTCPGDYTVLYEDLAALVRCYRLGCALACAANGTLLARVGDLEPNDPLGAIGLFLKSPENWLRLKDALAKVPVFGIEDGVNPGHRFAIACMACGRVVIVCGQGLSQEARSELQGKIRSLLGESDSARE